MPLVFKDNRLTQELKGFGVNEYRLLLTACSILTPEEKRNGNRIVTIRSEDIANQFNLSKWAAYKLLERASKQLWNQSIVIEDKINDNTKYFRILSYMSHDRNSSKVTMHLTDDLLKYLTYEENNKNGWTLYDISEMALLTRAYSIRLYELINQFKNLGQVTMEIDKFKDYLGIIKGSCYDNSGVFTRDVLKNCINDINLKTKYTISYEYTACGRKYNKIHLYFNIKETLEEPKVKIKNPLLQKKIDEEVAITPAKSKLEFDFSGFNEKEMTSIQEWFKYKQDIKKSYKSQQSYTKLRNQLLEFKKNNILIEAIDQSIANGYQGLFAPKSGFNSTKGKITFNTVGDFSNVKHVAVDGRGNPIKVDISTINDKNINF